MTVLITFTTVLLVLDCAVLIGMILLQRGRGGGLASAFGGLGAEGAFGTRAATMAQKVTTVCAILFVVLTIALGWMRRYHQVGSAAAPLPVKQAAEPTKPTAPEKPAVPAPAKATPTRGKPAQTEAP